MYQDDTLCIEMEHVISVVRCSRVRQCPSQDDTPQRPCQQKQHPYSAFEKKKQYGQSTCQRALLFCSSGWF